jgi:hypothetical protein
VLKSVSAASDLELISDLRSIPDAHMRRGVRFPAWFLLLVAVLGILGGCQSLGDLERCSFGEGFADAVRHHAILSARAGRGAAAAAVGFLVPLLLPAGGRNGVVRRDP